MNWFGGGGADLRLLNSIAAPDYIVVDPQTGTILRRQDGPTDEKHFLEFLRGTR